MSAQLNISRAELDTLLAEDAATDTPADVWAYMKRQLYKRYPEFINLRGQLMAVADALEEIWKEIPESLLGSLYTSMPRRVAAVIETEGWYTKY